MVKIVKYMGVVFELIITMYTHMNTNEITTHVEKSNKIILHDTSEQEYYTFHIDRDENCIYQEKPVMLYDEVKYGPAKLAQKYIMSNLAAEWNLQNTNMSIKNISQR